MRKEAQAYTVRAVNAKAGDARSPHLVGIGGTGRGWTFDQKLTQDGTVGAATLRLLTICYRDGVVTSAVNIRITHVT